MLFFDKYSNICIFCFSFLIYFNCFFDSIALFFESFLSENIENVRELKVYESLS